MKLMRLTQGISEILITLPHRFHCNHLNYLKDSALVFISLTLCNVQNQLNEINEVKFKTFIRATRKKPKSTTADR